MSDWRIGAGAALFGATFGSRLPRWRSWRPVVLASLIGSAALGGCGGGSSDPAPPPPPPSTKHTVGGNVSGLGVGDRVSLLNDGADKLSLTDDGVFAFPTSQQEG